MTIGLEGSHLRGMNERTERGSAANAKREADRAKALRANLRRRKTALGKGTPAKTEPVEDGPAD